MHNNGVIENKSNIIRKMNLVQLLPKYSSQLLGKLFDWIYCRNEYESQSLIGFVIRYVYVDVILDWKP